ncbi:MAG: pilus assembly PilX N-terminal domain-containing protein [Patescibacteria group bacterium]
MKPWLDYEKNHKGQVLVTLLMFVLVAMTVITSAVIIVIANTRAASEVQQGIDAYYVAEAGAENALMRLLRDPNYTGETLPSIGEGTAVITVTGSTIVSQGQVNNLTRKIQVNISYNNNQMTVTNWQEIP